jgi:hypothetical protein
MLVIRGFIQVLGQVGLIVNRPRGGVWRDEHLEEAVK